MPIQPISLKPLPRLGLNWHRSFAEIAWTWAQIAAAMALVAWKPWTLVIAIPFIAARQYALAVLLHDGQHRLLHPRRQVNDWIARWILAAPLGADFEASRQSHFAHHRYLGNKLLDPDYPIYTGRWARAGGVKAPWGTRVAIHVGIALLLTLCVAWWAYPVLWLLPLVIAGILDRLRIKAEHLPDGAFVSHHSNPVERFFLSPFDMNYHAEHHFNPGIPHYRLRETRASLKAMDLPGEWVGGSYWRSLWG